MSKIIDMHMHSTYSDGQFCVNDLVKLAKKNNVGLMAVTDHDDLRSAKEIKNILNDLDMSFTNGIELSTMTSIDGKDLCVHILGYGYDENNNELNNKLLEKRKIRELSNLEYLKRLCEKYAFLNPKIIDEIEKDKFIRFSRLIIKYLNINNYSEEEKQLIADYMNENIIIYPNYEFSDEESISLLLNSNGIPVLAHPYQYHLTEEEEIKLIRKLKEMGLKGLEICHSGDTPSGMKLQKRLSKENELLESIGSDFHTDYNDFGNSIGLGKNNNLCIEDCSLVKVLKKENKIYRR